EQGMIVQRSAADEVSLLPGGHTTRPMWTSWQVEATLGIGQYTLGIALVADTNASEWPVDVADESLVSRGGVRPEGASPTRAQRQRDEAQEKDHRSHKDSRAVAHGRRLCQTRTTPSSYRGLGTAASRLFRESCLQSVAAAG